jgi:hypothetical protein
MGQEYPTEELAACCREVIAVLGRHNSMMACPLCKAIIKFFPNSEDLRHYLVFCEQKKRDVRLYPWGSGKIVTFTKFV